MNNKKISLALSGGGSRAIAFHLGCMRALYKKDMLKNIDVISTISGGSIIGAIYVYTEGTFEEFDKEIIKLLKNGLKSSIIKELLKKELILNGLYNFFDNIIRRKSTLRKSSRLIAFMNVLDKKYFFNKTINNPVKKEINIVINSTELSTKTAFRFGSKETGNWRCGKLKNNDFKISKAVVASAAYPLIFPSLKYEDTFVKDGEEKKAVVFLSDGGIYDNLGTTCLEIDKTNEFSYNAYPSKNIICCNAGEGQRKTLFFPILHKRIVKTIDVMMYRIENQSINQLFSSKKENKIENILYSHLGQKDDEIKFYIPNLIEKEKVYNYPTDFNPMNVEDINLITKRGEQLMTYLIENKFS